MSFMEGQQARKPPGMLTNSWFNQKVLNGPPARAFIIRQNNQRHKSGRRNTLYVNAAPSVKAASKVVCTRAMSVFIGGRHAVCSILAQFAARPSVLQLTD